MYNSENKNFVDVIRSLLYALLSIKIYKTLARIYKLILAQIYFIRFYLKYGYPQFILYFGIAPGDDLLCTAVIYELKKRGVKKIWMASNHPEIFNNNDEVSCIIPFHPLIFHHPKFHLLEYARHNFHNDTCDIPQRHIIAEMCIKIGLQGEIELKPRIFLTPEEISYGKFAKGKLLVQSSSMSAVHNMKNKQWYTDRFQQVVDSLCKNFEMIQIGSISDPLLDHVMDLRGQTTVRQTAAILKNSLLFIGIVGFLMHLARAVDCRSVIIYGGREAPWQSGYSLNFNIYKQLECSPCWRYHSCEFERMCMQEIQAEEVISAVNNVVNHTNLEVRIDDYILTDSY